MCGDFRLEPETETGWFPDGIEILPGYLIALGIAAVLVGAVAMMAARLRLAGAR